MTKTKSSGKPLRSTDVFEDSFARLNPEQRLAVDTIEGPVMVIAGPGTGKTQTIALRVANILRRTQMRPSNVLCLTFSVAGAVSMRERLRSLIGPDAYGVTVSTIHGFCQSIIDQHPQLFEEVSARNQISDMEKFRELNVIIDRLMPGASLINPRDPYGKDADILSRISQVKQEGKTIEQLKEALAAFDAEMSHKSKLGTKAHAKNLLAVKKFADFVEIFSRYQQMLLETGRYDYDDMIAFVLSALRTEDWLLAGLQERFQYVLVDEFQDTNGSQWAVIDQLTQTERAQQEPNLFVVGDDDQAIYRFQGANVQNMMKFRQRFPHCPVITLRTSYRSTQRILDAARSLIERNEERLTRQIPDIQKVLTSASADPGTEPVMLFSPSDVAEPWMIAQFVEEELAAGTAPDEIAILTRSNQEMDAYFDVLRAKNIPVVMFGKRDLFNHPLVKQAFTIIDSLTSLRHDGALADAISCECFGCHPADLSRLFLAARSGETSLEQVLTTVADDPKEPFVKPDTIIAARDTLFSLSQHAGSRTVLDTVEHVLRDCHLLPDAARGNPLDLGAIEAFFQYVKSRCSEHPSYEFKRFLSDIRFYADPQYGQVRLAYTLPHLTENGVQLMTAHQSKGREFEVVILANFKDGHWDKKRTHSLVSVPEDLLYGWGKEQKAFEQSQDERRLAFVAMTRAKRRLVFSCPMELSVGDKTKAVAPSAFFAEAGALPEVHGELKDPASASLLTRQPLLRLDRELTAYLKDRLTSFMLSATALNRFLKDPQEFLAVDLLGQPEAFDESSLRRLAYGNAVHWALRKWGAAKQTGAVFDAADLLREFEWHIEHRSILTDKQRKDIIYLGKENLPVFFDERLGQHEGVVYAIEREYKVRMGEIPLKGRIDRIDVPNASSAAAVVIDYKARAPMSESVIRGGLESGEISRSEEGNYFRQLAFYALLLESGDPMLKPQAFAIEFLGDGEEKPLRREFVVSSQECETLRELIGEVWEKILALDFTPLTQDSPDHGDRG